MLSDYAFLTDREINIRLVKNLFDYTEFYSDEDNLSPAVHWTAGYDWEWYEFDILTGPNQLFTSIETLGLSLNKLSTSWSVSKNDLYFSSENMYRAIAVMVLYCLENNIK